MCPRCGKPAHLWRTCDGTAVVEILERTVHLADGTTRPMVSGKRPPHNCTR